MTKLSFGLPEYKARAEGGGQTAHFKRGESVMKKMVKDGWHKVCGYDVYVEDGEVKRAISDGCTAYPYRASRYGGWDKDTHLSLDALRAGLSRETIIIR